MRPLLALITILLLSACGMKGDLYQTQPPDDPDKDERKTIPATPDPAKAE